MKPVANAFYDGLKLTLATPQDEMALRDIIYGTVKSFVNQRKHWLLETQGNKMKVQVACTQLSDFVILYKHYSLKAVAKKLLALEPHLYTIMPNPEKKQADWCFKIETIIAICNAYLKQYAHHNLYQRPQG